MIDLSIGVVGAGVVGLATAKAYVEHVREVRIYDRVPEKATHPVHEVLGSDIIFVCLPSPPGNKDGAIDTEIIQRFFGEIRGSRKTYILKSTVPIGTTQMLRSSYNLPNLIYSPEFLTARCAVTDAQTPTRLIIGVPDLEEQCIGRTTVLNLYQVRFPHVLKFLMTYAEAEACKLLLNSFFAVKVALFNEFKSLTDHFRLDYETVRAGILADGRISSSHTQVPGPDGNYGFGGTCLPKDLATIVWQLGVAGLDNAVTAAALYRNEDDRRREL
jgi:UDPglucose 6-dehydrogenase